MSNLTEKELAHLSYCQKALSDLHQYLIAVNRFPHEGQAQVLRALFKDGKKILMGQCGRSLGKALDVSTPILTTDGWSTMGDLEEGDYVFAPNGKPVRIIATSPIMFDRDCYRVVFSDGNSIVADAEHLWLTDTKEVRKSQSRNHGKMLKRSPLKHASVVTTRQMAETLCTGKRGERNHRIKCCEPLEFSEKDLPIHPYVLGVWLGDGNSRDGRIYTMDQEILDRISSLGYEYKKVPSDSIGFHIYGIAKILRNLGVLGKKAVPAEYLFSSREQRLELLRGLFDTDGYASPDGTEFVNTNRNIADAVEWLAISLGMKVMRKEKIPTLNGKPCTLAYRLRVVPNADIFFLSRKRLKLSDRIGKIRNYGYRFVWSVEKVPSVPVRCIAVDHPSSLFLAGKALIPTHNSELILYMAWRFALTHPGTETYIITPEVKQAKKIYWFPRRIQSYGPRHFVAEEFESKLQVLFTNGSYILLDGCENYEGHRGSKPDFVIYDEFQHHTKFFDEEVMQPNLSRGDIALAAFGTPPKRDCYYIEFRNNVLDKIQAGHPDYFYIELPSENNPILDKAWLAEKKADLFAKGKQNVWYREYEGKLVFDTESAIFPMFDKIKIVKSPEFIRSKFERDVKKLDWYAVFDPGTASCFAVLFIAVNPYTSEVFLLDEIYEQRREYTSSMLIWQRADSIKASYNPDLPAWINIYDEAAAWFQNEVRRELSGGDFALIPTRKHKKTYLDGENGREGESVIMSMMLNNKLFASSNCEKFIWEMEQYVKDELGRYPRHNDHLVDDLHYFVNNTNYTVTTFQDPEEEEREEISSMRTETFEQVIDRELKKRDPTRGIEAEFYDDDREDSWI